MDGLDAGDSLATASAAAHADKNDSLGAGVSPLLMSIPVRHYSIDAGLSRTKPSRAFPRLNTCTDDGRGRRRRLFVRLPLQRARRQSCFPGMPTLCSLGQLIRRSAALA